MRIIFVRHGEPNYEKDCLTEEGKRQAEAAAERLAGEGISEIYSSPMGRAYETACCTAQRLNLPVTRLDFMHEISWGGPGVPENGHPWTLSDWMMDREGFDFSSRDWRQHPYFRDNAATEYFDRVTAQFDAFLEREGYRHEGRRFLCLGNTEKTIAVFSHGGSGACVLAHLLTLPFPYVLKVMTYDYTSVIILKFPDTPGEYVHPRLELFNDAAHIRKTAPGPLLQQKPD